jgi:predicted O-linked N-acetylglucosamine transferase (SPINDLY family)
VSAAPSRDVLRFAQQLRSGRARECKAGVLRLLARFPRDPALLRLGVECLAMLDETHAALHHARACLALAPDDAGMLMNAGRLHARLGQSDDALRALDRAGALGLVPATTEALELRLGMGRFVEALDLIDASADRDDAFTAASRTLLRAQALLALGDVDACARACRDVCARAEASAAALAPLELPARAVLASALNYAHEAPRAEVFEAHRRIGALLDSPPLHDDWQGHPRDASRVLRVGFVSPDLRTHSVSCFVEPLLRHLAEHAIEAHAYHLSSAEDATSERLRTLVKGWRRLPYQDPAEVARAIREDRIDVAIDLAGLTNTVGVSALALGAAPVSVTYLGYPNTTGSARVHARIVDAITDPPIEGHASPDTFATERLVRLPRCFVCYEGPPDAPRHDARAIQTTPATPVAPITFASFNAVQKINPRIAALWSRVLRRVPDSRLLLKANGLREPRALDLLSERLRSWGLPMERVDLVPTVPTRAEHLAMYARVDVALDTFPYHGTTTTCEALWMGVPVVTLAGEAHASRVGVSLLTCVGLEELIVHDEHAYVELCASLAADRPRLARYRATLRDRVATSPLCDGQAFAKSFADALRQLWSAWCEGPSPVPPKDHRP